MLEKRQCVSMKKKYLVLGIIILIFFSILIWWFIPTRFLASVDAEEIASIHIRNGNNGNYLALLDSPNETSLWDITFDLFSAKISNVSIPERCIQYNISSPRFSCYKGTQYNPKIYIIG